VIGGLVNLPDFGLLVGIVLEVRAPFHPLISTLLFCVIPLQQRVWRKNIYAKRFLLQSCLGANFLGSKLP
jgi:hypothetical protein